MLYQEQLAHVLTSGSLKVKPGDVLAYRHVANIAEAKITWSIIYGSMEIVSGQGTGTTTVKFGNDFTSGCLIVSGENVKFCQTGFSIVAE